VVVIGATDASMYGAVFDPAADAWSGISYAPVAGRDGYAAAWTGAEVVVWGGADGRGQLADGLAFDPSIPSWRQIAPAPLSARSFPAAAWTGREILIVGGGTDEGSHFRDAAAYDPSADSWRSVPPLPVSGRFSALASWTGAEIVVWGGVASRDFPVDGARYVPSTDSWELVAPAPVAGRMEATAVWSGSELLIWGGTRRSEGGPQLADGCAYDPRSDSWRTLAPSPIVGRYAHGAVWTGDRMLVWGGTDEVPGDDLPRGLGDGASYDPAADEWTALPAAPVVGRFGPVTVWTGEEMIVWGGCCQSVYGPANFVDGAAYKPARAAGSTP